MQSNEGQAITWRERLTTSTASFLPGVASERIALLLLLLLALVLRFWGFPSIPYTHDEISGLLRVDYPGISEALASGAWKVDAHPPATHFFLLLWTQLVGFGDGAVKAPFILMSVLALFCLYRFAHAWAGATVALLLTALLTTMQYTVMYGQIARPYAMGFFTTALLADQLTRYLGTGRRMNLVLAGVAALLSALTHHFAAMLAALMCATVLLLVEAPRRKALLVALGVALVAYLPNLPLLSTQLGIKGLENWLDPPNARWTLDYAWWIAHCSVLFSGALVLLLAGSALLRIRHRGSSRPVWAITLLWGLLPLVVGYAYSVWRAPVLQYSVLLFSFPYVLLGLFAGLRHLKPTHGIAFSGIVAILSVFTLVRDRRHYAIFNTSKYEAIVRGTQQAEKDGALAVVDLPPEVMAFYRKLWCITPSHAPFVNLRQGSVTLLDSLLNTTSASSIFYGQTTQAEPENVALVQARFPFMFERHDLNEGQTFMFATTPQGSVVMDLGSTHMKTPEAIDDQGWQVDPKIQVITDTTGYMPLKRWDFSGHEYGAVYDGPVYELAKTDNDVIEVRADFAAIDPSSDMSLVVELKNGDITHFYRASQMHGAPHTGTTARLITAVKLADIPGHGAGLRLRTYLYNKSRKTAWVSGLSLAVRAGNPVLYGLFQPLKGRWHYRSR